MRERAAEARNEYIGGRMRPMPANNLWHNLIVGALVVEIGQALKGRRCKAFAIQMRVKIPATGLCTCPDLVALCGDALLEDEHNDTLLNPSLIIEVLSEQTETYDRGDKFAHYRQLETLREYILVSQNRPSVEQYVRRERYWDFREVSGLDASLTIETLACSVALADIYDRVEFPPLDDVEVARWPVIHSPESG